MHPTDFKLHILVVDDSPNSAEAMAALLQTWGHDTVSAYSGRQALALAEVRRPDCVLLDVLMPVMDGVDLSRRLREQFGGDITLIAMTGAEISGLRYQVIIGTVDHFLKKPIDSAALKHILRHVAQ